MRIAYLAEDTSPNGFYRGVGPMDHLAYRGHTVHQLSRCRPRERFATVRDVDVLHIHRYCDEQHTHPLVREAQRHGAAIVWDDDDDMASVPKSNPVYQKRGALYWERRTAGMKELLRVADMVTCTNPTLAARLGEHGARHTTVIENYVPGLFLLRREYGTRPGVTIGWVAGKEHQADIEQVPIREALARILDARPDVHVVSVGLGLGLESDRYRKQEKVPILQLADHTSRFDIGIAPLADTAFNRSKSNVKLKEYAAGGTPWLASPVAPYAGMGEKHGGRLVPDDRWYEELLRLVDKSRERHKLAKRAVKWIEGETLEKNSHRWEAAFADAIERGRGARHERRVAGDVAA